MKTITLMDTTVASDNLGDQIIVDAVKDVLLEVLPDAYPYTVATHEYMTKASKSLLQKSQYAFVAGTNILASNMEARVLWKLYPWDAYSFNNAVLLGCGWMNYMKAPNKYSAWLLKKVLSSEVIHSVRDSYTEEKLRSFGKRVVNTSCPTMWKLNPEHCAKIPTTKAPAVVTTLTHYLNRPEEDGEMLRILKERYERVYFWPQQHADMEYFQKLSIPGILQINPTLAAYNDFLDKNNIDFVGTRLHGGIRAMQKFRRALIVKVDNRATEISKDTGLPTMDRKDFKRMREWIDGSPVPVITLPLEAIATWKGQFV
ncbi:polysaccharide pyruvyl transferase family protein [Rhizobium sp. CC-YZS058]|uniref:polysaccharide pyruvyl transferase family protein n=1 Tax=Rhizobium sp. CC-YZS058 TaxID=3042153 RepID=UPI002B05D335|nr:polysaccharide pyruvyl transferase family protein [Rhizobium sp. CC-YZS058]MEA3535448.1 polysaccharide pyruvyl transferase family protein [Rhizobium sp. CC-YZS058]